jgi:ATP-dependent DNA helicase RecG
MTALDDLLYRHLDRGPAKVLGEALGLRTVGDLLRLYPRRYVERGEVTDLAGLALGEDVTVLARVLSVANKRNQNRPGTRCEVTIGDGRATLGLTFFNQRWRQKQLVPGAQALFVGTVSEFRGRRQLTHPDFALLDGPADKVEELAGYTGGLLPVYPPSGTLRTWTITRCVRVLLDTLADLDDPLPADLRARHRLLPLREAWRGIHLPTTWADVERAKARLRWDEAYVMQAALAQRRVAARRLPATPRPPRADGLVAAFDDRLPFVRTTGQREVGDVLTRELAGDHPMHRLLQGEVGSGKTVVALRAMLAVVDAGGQAALLAPTEVLASQHVRSVRDLLGPLGLAGTLGSAEIATEVTLVTGSLSLAARRKALDAVASGRAGIVVGTHALLEDDVAFADLGLLVVDEQHRFGVEQRDRLRAKGKRPPHLLVMTATPIPRTVAMTVYGDLETSTLTEVPAGRATTSTVVVPAGKPAWVRRIWQRVTEEVAAGHQAFVVCPRIGGPDAEDAAGSEGEPTDEVAGELGPEAEPDAEGARPPAAAVLDVLPGLIAGPLAGLQVAPLHGRLPAADKDTVMRRFAVGELDVLVATTVIEVGVDVANATVMVVLDADRFGMSALHQLRGRVGRGTAPAWCLLGTYAEEGTPARARLDAVAATSDGFALARADLEQRREGDVLGVAQSGRRSQVRLLSLLRDEELIGQARDEANAVVGADPELSRHPALADAIEAMLGAERAEYLEKA